jgi:hypothetical protein
MVSPFVAFLVTSEFFKRVILSTTALLAAPTLCEWITVEDWDLVVVDEAHRISQGHKLYPVIEKLATRSSGFLAPSATPSSKELAGLSSLLALVAPEAFHADGTAVLEQRISSSPLRSVIRQGGNSGAVMREQLPNGSRSMHRCRVTNLTWHR